ncbi:Prolyl oligopeptidase family protein [Novipirellula galeiformis]|uniref:Prolyl oligopeptidase family protein n=1 Tax=Novipirellula galeiformis TaxID=2528004 RepID=A0A5C6CM33_9BACT|nr:prolyl oligopeptidase family serine peptidase [Novipirellula galeiformis]TWU25412.1 Prolyl oligopeptidase family protein [Novipirellula galeiformis]
MRTWIRNAVLALGVVTLETSGGIAQGQQAQEIRYLSSADATQQPAMFYAPASDVAVPLVVALHTWSGDYKQTSHKAIEAWCIEKGWAYIHPNFRGPNVRPEATGSEWVVKDIVSAVDYAKKTVNIDSNSVYLVGTSGGGYTALVMAGHHPSIWAGVSVWVPISDLSAWYQECKLAGRNYFRNVAASCGGAPGESTAIDQQYRDRSPLTYLANAKGVTLHLNAGIRDGHDGSVPISHSLLAFNEVASPQDRLSDGDIRYFVEKAQVPESLQSPIVDPSYGARKPLFRRTSGNATVTIFDGQHELIPQAAIDWFERIHANKDGKGH